MATRIRCGCGRIYDPAKHELCPDCGAARNAEVIVAAADKDPHESDVARATVIPPLFASIRLKRWFIPAVLATAGLCLIVLLLRLWWNTPRAEISPLETMTRADERRQETSPAQKTEWIIDAPGASGSDGRDLAAMIAKVPDGATIKLRPGVYAGGIMLNRPVRIIGASEGQSTIQARDKECLTVRAKGVTLENIGLLADARGPIPAISVAGDAELEMVQCTLQTTGSLGITASGNALLKATNCTLTATAGMAVQLHQNARGTFMTCVVADSQEGVGLSDAASADFQLCTFERNGLRNGKGAIAAIKGEKARLSADNSQFVSNPAGLSAGEGAQLSVSNSGFRDNGVAANAGNWVAGLIAVTGRAHATITGNSFHSNAQGIVILASGSAEIERCLFVRGGAAAQAQEPLLGITPIAVSGPGSSAIVRHTAIADSRSYGIAVIWGASLAVEDCEVTDSPLIGLLVGHQKGPASRAEVKRSFFRRNATGIGVCAGSSLTMEDAECVENENGAVAIDTGTKLSATRLIARANRDRGLHVHTNAEITATDCTIADNTRGAQSGMPSKSTLRGSLTLENCRITGNTEFGTGACSKSLLVLTNCVLDGNGKMDVYRERTAVVRRTDADSPAPATDDDEASSPSSGKRSTARSGTTSSGSKRSTPTRRSSSDRDRFEQIGRRIRSFLP